MTLAVQLERSHMETKPHKVLKVVSSMDVEMLTQQGWELVETLGHAQRLHTLREIEQQSHSGPNGVWVPEKYKVESAVITEPLFVLAKNQDIVDREMRILSNCADVQRTLDQTKEAFERVRLDNERLTLRAKQLEGERDTALKQLGDLQVHVASQDKLIATVRKEIGEARWREIDGSAVTCMHCIAEGR